MTSAAQLVMDQQQQGEDMTMPIVILVVLQQVVVTPTMHTTATNGIEEV